MAKAQPTMHGIRGRSEQWDGTAGCQQQEFLTQHLHRRCCKDKKWGTLGEQALSHNETLSVPFST